DPRAGGGMPAAAAKGGRGRVRRLHHLHAAGRHRRRVEPEGPRGVKRLGIDVQPGDYAVAKLDQGAAVPAGLLGSAGQGLVSVTRTPTELSVICPAASAPEGAQVEACCRLLTLRGPLACIITGLIAALANELAAAG